MVYHIWNSSDPTARTNHHHHGSRAPAVPTRPKMSCKHTHPRALPSGHHHKISHILHPRLLSRQTTWLDKQIFLPLCGSYPKPLAQVQPNKLSSPALLQCSLRLSSYYYYFYYFYYFLVFMFLPDFQTLRNCKRFGDPLGICDALELNAIQKYL